MNDPVSSLRKLDAKYERAMERAFDIDFLCNAPEDVVTRAMDLPMKILNAWRHKAEVIAVKHPQRVMDYILSKKREDRQTKEVKEVLTPGL